MNTPNRFFVMHVPDDWPGKSENAKYEIQLISDSGLAIAWIQIGDSETHAEINGESIPYPVIEAARRQLVGKGDFVDEAGRQVLPTDL